MIVHIWNHTMGLKQNLELATQWLLKIQPTCCALCYCRQPLPICNRCLEQLKIESKTRTCIVCARPNMSWVCKLCFSRKQSFDETIFLCNPTSRLFSLFKECSNGNIQSLSALMFAWEQLCLNKMNPVDIVIPFPENLISSQKRGYCFSMELAKRIASLNNGKILPQSIDHFLGWDGDSSFRMVRNLNKNYPFHQLRIAVVVPLMRQDYPLQQLALLLKELGAIWVSNWVLIRESK